MAKVFFSYCHKDEGLRDQLEAHLALLRNQGLIESWHDRRILPGDEFGTEIEEALEAADVILLLISADFLASRYCYSIEMKRAVERHEASQACVIPVILRDCDWHEAPFGKLQAVPKDARPITLWPDIDQAFAIVAKEIRRVVTASSLTGAQQRASTSSPSDSVADSERATLPRSSNLRLRKEFSEEDKDHFLREGFAFVARFFEGSLQELQQRNPGVRGVFDRIDTRRFAATVYRHGSLVSECSIRIDGITRRSGIAYSSDASVQSGSFNELLNVGSDEQSMFFKDMGFGFHGVRDAKLTAEGAAEYLWNMLVQRLQ